MIDCPSPNHDERLAPISMVVLHYTGMRSAEAAIERLTDGVNRPFVSAHYLVAEDGMVCAMVAEERRAWHAGRSLWRGLDDVNSRSIGIEIVNPGHEFGYVPFPEPQMTAVEGLLAGILARHRIAPTDVVGHSDVAPARKPDPGELFDWGRLAVSGLARAAPPPGPDPGWTDAGADMALARLGYDVADAAAARVAFCRRWRPATLAGAWDGEMRAVLRGLLAA